MNPLDPDRFNEFFEQVHGVSPFPWQQRLAEQVTSLQLGPGCWPEALALPTAAGKTACIDIAVFALACQANLEPDIRTAPRRIFFVVDRRIIVDATYERAVRLASMLKGAKDGIVREVADNLRCLVRDDGSDEIDPLTVLRMRGGTYRDDRWFSSPLQPAVVVSTVDQLGSRLLFRGYGPSHYMWPVHAGLACNDSLVILDEAHCANPFGQTLRSVIQYRQWTTEHDSILTAPFCVTLVSATPPGGVEGQFTAEEEDRRHNVLGPRIACPKPARLVQVRAIRNEASSLQWPGRIATEAIKLLSDDRKVIGIIVNRVATAKAVHHALLDLGHQSLLLTGRMRPLDYDYSLEHLEGMKTGGSREGLGNRFVVSTQTLEVGADLDFDGLVTECASLDALRQRFGRLNRAGRWIEARASILGRSDQAGKGRVDPIYGEALSRTWEWLQQEACEGEVDFGVEAFEKLLPTNSEDRQKLLRALSAPAPDAPIMMPSHIDAWAQTSPTPEPDPDVSVFLHGPDQGAPDVQVCWRADLPQHCRESDAVDIISMCPPVSAECIPVPISIVRSWLAGNDDSARDLSDLAGMSYETDSTGAANRSVLIWRGPEDSGLAASRPRLRPGDTLVIPTALGGWDSLGHIPEERDIDIGDEAHLKSRGIPLLRLHRDTLQQWPECPAKDKLRSMAQDASDMEDVNEFRQLLEEVVEHVQTPDWLTQAALAWVEDPRPKMLSHPGGGLVLRGSRKMRDLGHETGTPTDEDDTYSATVEVSLQDHLDGVTSWAKRFARGVGLPDDLAQDITMAAQFHDEGKADPRFQALLHGGNPWAAEASGALLAKSGSIPLTRREHRRACRESGFPMGGRHELLSVRMVESAKGLLESANDPDLVLHLVASHHGRCRPFAPVVKDSLPQEVEDARFGHAMFATSPTLLDRLDSGVPERFWRLVRRYGWWGLAWLEALLRLADHSRSEEERTCGVERPGRDAE